MTDTSAATADPHLDDPEGVAVEETEPEADEGADLIQLTRTGWVRFTWGDGQRLRLRRPFLGELKALRLAAEDMNDEISAASEHAALLSAKMMTEGEQIDSDDALPLEDKVRRRQELRRESTLAGRKLTEIREAGQVGWWRQAVDTLGVDGELPEDAMLPAWFVDPALIGRIIQHWRAVPLARG